MGRVESIETQEALPNVEVCLHCNLIGNYPILTVKTGLDGRFSIKLRGQPDAQWLVGRGRPPEFHVRLSGDIERETVRYHLSNSAEMPVELMKGTPATPGQEVVLRAVMPRKQRR